MVKKALDSRIPTLIRNAAQLNHRGLLLMVGDRSRDQIPNIHYLVSQATSSRPSVLWCYRKDLGFTTHRKIREKKLRKEIKKGLREVNDQDPFELFVSVTDIRYCYYKETEKILGNTYGMCILQDFEALTPNLLARTVETVSGGGLVIILLKTMTSLKQLYTMTMDVHSRYRTEAHGDVTARFNERFLLSVSGCDACLVVDDELNVLPISAARSIKPASASKLEETPEREKELKELKESLKDTPPIGTLISTAKTVDQARAILTFIEAIAEKTLRSTVALTAARGRGKSAALGIAIAAAIAHGYANIFVTSPSPENLKTLFEFIFKTLDALGYEEHQDYSLVQSTQPELNKAIVRVNIFRDHRQTIQYIHPGDAHVLGQAELVVIDEAAAIPLPLVRALLGPYLVFMASTVNGYEGTGRSLSLKLIQQLREQSRGFVGRSVGEHTLVKSAENGQVVGKELASAGGGRVLREIKLEEPIRYSPNDPVESWLNKLLCLDASISPSRPIQGCPHPRDCDLFVVNRDTLFSFHPVSEAFLQRMMALYVASHYKNQPNDLQLMSDAPAHHLFVLLPPVKTDGNVVGLPDPLCVVQVCLEGEISRQSILNALGRGQRAGGDLIPWVVSQQYQDEDFANLSGARVVRIATHPDYQKMGYGARALDLIVRYFSGEFDDPDSVYDMTRFSLSKVTDNDLKLAGDKLHDENINVRDAKTMPPLLLKLSQVPAQRLHWVGVSYGLTAALHRFWKRSGFSPVYLRQTAVSVL